MKVLRLTALTIVAVFTSTIAAQAASCVAGDVRGRTWYAYVNYAGGWTRCIVQVLSTGAVAARANGCRSYDESTGTFTTFDVTAGGSLGVNSACLVTGQIKTDAGTHTVTEARLDPGKTVLVGAGRDGNGDAWTFSAVRN